MTMSADESAPGRADRNAIFGPGMTPPVATGGLERVSAADQARADFGGLDIPSEIAPLPSLGKTYPANHPLAGAEVVEIKGMTAKEEDILTSRALLKRGTVITELIRSCLIDKRVDPGSLLNGDRNALVTAIRVTGYGAEYEAEVDCADCGVKSPRTFDLSALPIKRLRIEPIEPNTNAFEFVLPFSKKRVIFKFMTGRDEEEISALSANTKKLNLGPETSVTTALLHSILSIEGVTDRAKIANFIRNIMPARDSLALRTFIKENEPGLEMKQEVECSQCGAKGVVDMPVGVTFLWPAAK